MDAPNTNTNLKVEKVEGEERKREEVMRLRSLVATLQKAYTKEVDQDAKCSILVELAAVQRELQRHLDELGLAGVSMKKGRPMNAFTLAAHLPTKEMTPKMIADLAAAGMATPEGAAAMSSLAATGATRPLVVCWQVPPLPEAPDVPSIAQFMAGAKSYKATQPIQRSSKDPHWKKGGGKANFCTVKPVVQLTGQDSEWIALLQQMPAGEFADEVYTLLREAAAEHYVGSGPLDGWFARIKKGDEIRRPQFTLYPHEVDAVVAALPWDHAKVVALKDLTLNEAFGTIQVNPSAGAGFPRQLKKGLCMNLLMEDAAQYYALMMDKKFNEYVRQNPGEFVTEVKNKHDRYELADYGKKIRPYYNVNGGMALLYSIAMQNYSKALLGFWEDRTSCNAHGFAWNQGGGQRLYDWVVWASKQKPGVYAIGYSDDGLWVIVSPDGTVLIGDKDIAQCDQSLGCGHRPTMVRHFRDVVKDKYGPGWQQVAVSAINGIWTQLVVLYGPLTYLSEDKVHSGVVGTAEADQIGFATAFTLIRAAYDKARGTPLEKFSEAEEELKRRTGIQFKPSTWHKFVPDQEEYPWQFLGKRLVRIRGEYYPHVDLKKAIVQLITPKRNLKGDMGQKAWMERARGLGVTSLWTHPKLYDYVKAQYDRKLVSGTKPAPTLDGAETGETDVSQIMGQGVTILWPGGEKDVKFPPRSWVHSLYATPGYGKQEVTQGDGVVTTALSPAEQREPVSRALPTAADLLVGMFETERVDIWADTNDKAEDTRLALSSKLGDGQRLKPPEPTLVNPGAAQYSIPPLPEEVKRAFEKARKDARAALYLASVPSRRLRKGGRVAALEHGDFADVVFTAKGIAAAYLDAVEADAPEDFAEEEYEYAEDDYGNDRDDQAYWDRVEAAWRAKHGRRAEQPEDEPWVGDADEGLEAR